MVPALHGYEQSASSNDALPTGITFQVPAEKRQNGSKNWTASCAEEKI
jgi:hypothetical protein